MTRFRNVFYILFSFIINIQLKLTIMMVNSLFHRLNNKQINPYSYNKCKLFATKKTGTFFKTLPNVYPAAIHFNRAVKSIKTVKHDPNIKNARNLNRKFAAQSLDALMKSLTIPISQLLFAYQNKIKELHPYEVYYIYIIF